MKGLLHPAREKWAKTVTYIYCEKCQGSLLGAKEQINYLLLVTLIVRKLF